MNPASLSGNDFRKQVMVGTANRLSPIMTVCKYKIFMIIIQLFVPVTRTFLEPQQVRQSGRVR